MALHLSTAWDWKMCTHFRCWFILSYTYRSFYLSCLVYTF